MESVDLLDKTPWFKPQFRHQQQKIQNISGNPLASKIAMNSFSNPSFEVDIILCSDMHFY